MKKQKFYRCEHCGNLFEVLQDSGVTPVCCGQNMTELVPNTSDGAGEKHVPAIERNGKDVLVRIGSVAHPMLDEHFIQWIVLAQGDISWRRSLKPGQAPEARFTVNSETDPIVACEYCNLHGLWSAEG